MPGPRFPLKTGPHIGGHGKRSCPLRVTGYSVSVRTLETHLEEDGFCPCSSPVPQPGCCSLVLSVGWQTGKQEPQGLHLIDAALEDFNGGMLRVSASSCLLIIQ